MAARLTSDRRLIGRGARQGSLPMNEIYIQGPARPIRIAAVRYLNTAPLIEGLQALNSIAVTTAAPSHIADMVTSGDADLGLVSIIDAVKEPARGRGPLAIVPVGMIGCDGPTLTVRIFSGVPIDQIRTLHADTDSHTSVALARVLLRRITGRAIETVDFDARERVEVGTATARSKQQAELGRDSLIEASEWPTSLLLIGDKVVTDSPPAVRYPYQLDLGEAWKAWTGLPFVYAAWMCRAEDATSEHVRFAASILDRQLRHNLTRLDWIVAHKAAEHRWPADLAQTYIRDLLRYQLGSREREGATRFFHEAANLGIVAAREPIWIDAIGPLAALGGVSSASPHTTLAALA